MNDPSNSKTKSESCNLTLEIVSQLLMSITTESRKEPEIKMTDFPKRKLTVQLPIPASQYGTVEEANVLIKCSPNKCSIASFVYTERNYYRKHQSI